MELIGPIIAWTVIGALSAFIVGFFVFAGAFFWVVSPLWPKTTTDSEQKDMPLFCPIDGRALTPAVSKVMKRSSFSMVIRGFIDNESYRQIYMACHRFPRFWNLVTRFADEPVHTHYYWVGPTEEVKVKRYNPGTGLPL